MNMKIYYAFLSGGCLTSDRPSSFLPPPPPAEEPPKAPAAFPDSVVQSLQATAVGVASATLDAQTALTEENPLPPVGLQQAKQMIIDALEDFDPRLGQAARDVFNDSRRLNIQVMPEGETGIMMRVRPADLTKEDAMSIDKHPDIERLRKNFPIDHNPEKFAIIDFQYDGTMTSVIYLAHELGHAIADDYQQRHGGYSKNPQHMEETQAYLVQSIFTAHLQENTNPAIAAAARRHFTDEMAGHVYAYPLAKMAEEALEAVKTGAPVHSAASFQKAFGQNWDSIAIAPPGRKEEDKTLTERVFDALEAVNTAQQEGRAPDEKSMETLQKAIDRLHDRPTNQLVAVGIAASLQGQKQETKSKVSEMVLGLYGPKSISDVLDEAGVKGPESMQRFMQATIETATTPLLKSAAQPAMQMQAKQQTNAPARTSP